MMELSELSGEIEMDEAMFGVRVPRNRGWGAAGKRMVFGLYQRNGKVLAFPVTNRGTQDVIPLMIRHAKAGSLYYTDDWHAYTFLDIRGNHVVIKKEKGNPKAEITSIISKDFGLTPSIGFVITGECPRKTSISI